MPKIKIITDPKGTEPIKVNKTIKPVDPEDANMEAEKGEVVITDTMMSGFPESFKVAGERHSQGGAPLDLPANSFVFSRDKSMRIKNEDILESFGKKPKKIGYSPAEIAKQYDINEYRKILADPDSDRLQRETAELMIENYNSKIGKLSLVQESMKGFPNGIPFTAVSYLESMGIDPSMFITGSGANTDTEADSMMREGGPMKIRIKGFQKGGPTKGDDEFVMNDEFMASLAEKLGAGDVTGAISPFMAESQGMVGRQKAIPGKGAVHGRVDWTDAEHFPDFRNRNAWYFKDHPEFNPRDSKQVKAFQQAYNEKAVGMGLKPYFSDKSGTKYSVDGKFGEVTFNTPNLDYRAPQAPAAAPAEPAPGLPALVAPTMAEPVVPPPGDNPFWTQDLINVYGAASDYAHINKYQPWQAGYQTLTPEPTFFDPTRELAANSEQAAIAGNVLGAFAGPQQLNARLSEVQGRGLENVANILGKYNNLNVGVANQFEQQRVGILNADSLNRANRATDLYDKTVIANQMYDNAKAQARAKMRQSFIDAWTNRGRTQALNSVNKQYRVDPRTGFVNFTGVPGRIQAPTTKTLKEEFDSVMSDPNMRQYPEIAYKMALQNMGITADDQLDSRMARTPY